MSGGEGGGVGRGPGREGGKGLGPFPAGGGGRDCYWLPRLHAGPHLEHGPRVIPVPDTETRSRGAVSTSMHVLDTNTRGNDTEPPERIYTFRSRKLDDLTINMEFHRMRMFCYHTPCMNRNFAVACKSSDLGLSPLTQSIVMIALGSWPASASYHVMFSVHGPPLPSQHTEPEGSSSWPKQLSPGKSGPHQRKPGPKVPSPPNHCYAVPTPPTQTRPKAIWKNFTLPP